MNTLIIHERELGFPEQGSREQQAPPKVREREVFIDSATAAAAANAILTAVDPKVLAIRERMRAERPDDVGR